MIKSRRVGEKLTIYLTGEIDHHAVTTLREDIDKLLDDRGVKLLELNFADVEFMDSSGIGMIIGRYKIMKARQGQVSATGLSDNLERIYRLGGLHRIVPIDDNGGKNEQ